MILELVNDFVLAFTDLSQPVLFQGYENRTALPPDNDGFCVMTIADSERRGTNIDKWEDVIRHIKKLTAYTVDVDFVGWDNEKQRERASKLEIMAWSNVAQNFFKKANGAMLYADPLQYLPYVDEDEQSMHRYRVRLHISLWEDFPLDVETAKEVIINAAIHGVDPETGKHTYKDGIENVDVYHKEVSHGDSGK